MITIINDKGQEKEIPCIWQDENGDLWKLDFQEVENFIPLNEYRFDGTIFLQKVKPDETIKFVMA